MSKEILIDISNTGKVHGLHFEELPLTTLGRASIKRATDIKFNSDTQLWDINLLDTDESTIPHHPDHLGDFDSYEVARGHEVRFLQACRLQGVNTVSQAGDDLGAQLRDSG